ncbi:MAG: hypothetical protein ABMA64_38280 [Myxococcota bacterium]
MLNLLAACIAVQTSTLDPTPLPPETDTGGTKIDTGGSTTPTPPSTVSGCAAVTGTRAVWLIDRADPTKVVKPVQPPVSTEVTWEISGPDALGRLYLLDQSKGEGFRIHRSDDGGCTWQLTGSAPSGLLGHMYTGPTSSRLYVRYDYDLYVSEDGGVSFTQVSTTAPRAPMRVIGGSPDHLWASVDQTVWSSADGGVTWTAQLALEVDGVGFDWSDPPRLAAGGAAIQVWEDPAWSTVLDLPDERGWPVWEPGGGMWVLVRNSHGLPEHSVRSADGAAPFVATGWSPAYDEQIRHLVPDDGALATGGILYDGAVWGGSYVSVRTADGALVRHDAEAFEDVIGLSFTDTAVVAALRVPGTEQPD